MARLLLKTQKEMRLVQDEKEGGIYEKSYLIVNGPVRDSIVPRACCLGAEQRKLFDKFQSHSVL